MDCDGDGTWDDYHSYDDRTRSHTFTCGGSLPDANGAICSVYGSSVSRTQALGNTLTWRTRNSCQQQGTDYTPICGNGILDAGETCERAVSLD